MGWLSLGNITLAETWQSFPESALGYETFRLIHTTVVDPYVNSAFLSRWFPAPSPGGRFSPWRRIYPSSDPTVLELPIPQAYVDQGIVVYDVQMKWRLPYYPVPWIVELQALV